VKKVTLLTLIFWLAVQALTPSLGQARKRPPKKRHKTSSAKTAEAKRDLEKVRAEIAKFEAELREHEAREAKSKKNLKAFNARSAELRRAIERLKAEAQELAAEKSEVDTKLTHTTKRLDDLKTAYANGARYLYQSGKLRETTDANEFLLAPAREDSLLRMRYYAQSIAKAHHASGEELNRAKTELGESSAELGASIASERQQIGRQTTQQETIEQKRADEAKQLGQIQANKERVRKLLAERKASAKKLENMIASIVTREERATKERGTRKTHRGRVAPEEEPLAGPARGPHSLAWPTASHRIVQGFGEHRNAELNTVTMNLGVDIGAPKGSAVTASAEGIVSIVSSLPSYGTIVVVRHSGNLHTVYADLSAASAHSGEHVKAGQTIGRSGANEENGPVLHFEVWKGRAKQNPMGWLK
jgi:septal ring factor EnvC (AmiA/AmiB activator)